MDSTITLNPGDRLTIVAAPGAAAPPEPAPVTIPPSPTPVLPVPDPAPAPAWDLSLPIADLSAYLVQHRMPDGSPALTPERGVPQLASDVMTWRKRDYRYDGASGGYCASDGVSDPRGFWVTTWQFSPYAAFNPANGDGGEVYTYDEGVIHAGATQDGGTPTIQFFVGRSGDRFSGWVCFDDQSPTGSWRYHTDLLSDASDPNAQPQLGEAFVRWRREVLTLRFRVFGSWRDITLPCIIYEHWDHPDIASSVNMEQAIWALGWGRVWWGAYTTTPNDLGQRVPALPWPQPPERADLRLSDARLWTDIVAVAPGEASAVEWPPAGFVA